MIGTSDGEQYEDSFAHTIATMGPGASEKPADALKTDLGTQVADNTGLRDKGKLDLSQEPGEWDVGGKQYQEHFKQPANKPPEGDWGDVDEEGRKALMWGTGVVASRDPALTEGSPKEQSKAVEDMLGTEGSIRGWSDIPAFKEFEKKLPEGVKAYHLKDGTTIFHKPKKGEPLTS